MIKQANADLNLFIEKEFELGPGEEPGAGRKYNKLKQKLWDIFQGNNKSLTIAHHFENLTQKEKAMRIEMLQDAPTRKDQKEINMMFEQINADRGGVDRNTSTPQDPLWGKPEPKKRDTPLW